MSPNSPNVQRTPVSRKDHRSLALWAADCAAHVLLYFEENCPEDDRPRKAVEAGRAWARGELSPSQARAAAFAAHSAARDADHLAARAAARAAGHAAATAHVASHAHHAAAYAVKAAAGTSSATELAWQRQTPSGAASPSSVSAFGARHRAAGSVGSAAHFPAGKSMTKTEKLLRELIALPSVNPAFLPAQASARRGTAGGGVPGSHGGAGGARRGIPGGCPGPLQSPGAPLAPGQSAATALAGSAPGYRERGGRAVHAGQTRADVCLAGAPATPRVRWRPC